MGEPIGHVGQGFFDSLGIVGCTDGVEIGVGGFGVVYRARQPAYDRMVAVKLLNSIADDRAAQRFARECRALGGLSGHPNIVVLHDAGTTRTGRPYLVMEYLAQGSFADLVDRDGPLPWHEAAATAVKVAGAVETAHRRQVLHRDIKPENVLLSDYGEPKLADFGIAHLGDAATSRSQHITASIAHAPPEVLDGKRATVASDVYSLASSLYFLLTGRGAFVRPGDESIWPLILRTMQEPVPDLRPEGVPDQLAAVIEQAMAKDPADRHPTAAAFAQALAEVVETAGFGPIGLAVARTPDTEGVEIVRAAAPGDGDAAAFATTDPEIEPDADEIVPDAPPRRETRSVPSTPPPLPTGADPEPVAPVPAASTRRRTLLLLPVVALAVMAVLAISVLSGADAVAVPSVAGKTEDDALEALQDAGFEVDVRAIPDDAVRAGRAIGTDPEEGSELDHGADVILLVSTGPPLVAVPTSVVGMPVEDAQDLLDGLGLTAEVEQREDITVEPGIVLALGEGQSRRVPRGSPVVLIAATRPGAVTIPDLTGVPADQAFTLLEALELVVEPVDEPHPSIPGLHTVRTEPPADSPAAPGSTVRVVVSSGPAPAGPGPRSTTTAPPRTTTTRAPAPATTAAPPPTTAAPTTTTAAPTTTVAPTTTTTPVNRCTPETPEFCD